MGRGRVFSLSSLFLIRPRKAAAFRWRDIPLGVLNLNVVRGNIARGSGVKGLQTVQNRSPKKKPILRVPTNVFFRPEFASMRAQCDVLIETDRSHFFNSSFVCKKYKAKINGKFNIERLRAFVPIQSVSLSFRRISSVRSAI